MANKQHLTPAGHHRFHCSEQGKWYGHIDNYLQEAVAVAFDQDLPVECEFNGTIFVVTKGMTSGDALKVWTDTRKAAHATWEASTEGQAALRKQEEDRRVAQEKVDHLVANLPDPTDLKASIRWFCRLERAGSLPPAELALVMTHFEDAGHKTNQYSKLNDESLEDWELRVGEEGKLRWLLGQALSTTEFLGTPHQVIHKFAEELGC